MLALSPRVLRNELLDSNLHKAFILLLSDLVEEHLDETFLGLSLEVPPASTFKDVLLVESNEVDAVALKLVSVMCMGNKHNL